MKNILKGAVGFGVICTILLFLVSSSVNAETLGCEVTVHSLYDGSNVGFPPGTSLEYQFTNSYSEYEKFFLPEGDGSPYVKSFIKKAYAGTNKVSMINHSLPDMDFIKYAVVIDGKITYGYGTTAVFTPTIYSGCFVRAKWFFESPAAGGDPWWQVNGGDLISANGGIESSSVSCTGSTCFENLYDSASCAGDPGVPIYSPGYTIIPGLPNISSTNYNSQSQFLASKDKKGSYYGFSHFLGKLNWVPFVNLPEIVGSAYFLSNTGDTTLISGFEVFSRTGNLIIGDNTNFLNRKIIIFIDGDLTIKGKINVNDGKGFFMVIVSGDINISPLVGKTPEEICTSSLPEIEGIFITDKQFKTGHSLIGDDKQLFVRGIVVGLGEGLLNDFGSVDGVSFDRDLGTLNSSYPAEIFKYAPDQMLLFPYLFGNKGLIWKEVSP